MRPEEPERHSGRILDAVRMPADTRRESDPRITTRKRLHCAPASNRRNPGNTGLGRGSKPIGQLSRMMLKVPKVVELQFQFAERKPGES
jgi:hypothetical protein